MDTICALSSGLPPAGVAVVRISGAEAKKCLVGLGANDVRPRLAALRSLYHPSSGVLLDKALVLYFPVPNSFTGEECAELHLHGGRSVVSIVLTVLQENFGCRLAEAGEFTRRALMNGKIDALEVEGIGDLLRSETEVQRQSALHQASGDASALLMKWREDLIRTRALIEAEIDFADEDDVPDDVSGAVWSPVKKLYEEMAKEIKKAAFGERIRDGFVVAIVGPPNAGKSSLMNALADREVAIVTEIAGTTRDALSVDLDINGFPVRLVDTAGQRETDDVVEKIGVDRAQQVQQEADLVISLCEIDDRCWSHPSGSLRVGSKIDKLDGADDSIRSRFDLTISSKSGVGLDNLRSAFAGHLGFLEQSIEPGLITRQRHSAALQKAFSHIDDALADGQLLELRSEALRLASVEVGRIVGLVDVEDLLDVIFRDFCIGK